MKKIFFYIDRTNKQIRFIHYPIDRKGNMIGDTEQYSSISFDDVLTMTEEMNRSFFADLKTICERLQYYLDFGLGFRQTKISCLRKGAGRIQKQI